MAIYTNSGFIIITHYKSPPSKKIIPKGGDKEGRTFKILDFIILEIGHPKEAMKMKKGVVHRIEYFTRKVAEKLSVHPTHKQPRSYKYRSQRLKIYKELMHEEIRKYQEARLC